MTKAQMMRKILTAYSDIDGVAYNAWISVCPYCRTEIIFSSPKTDSSTPRFCASCGRTSPFHAFEANLQKTSHLRILASKMNRKGEKVTKNVLLEQALVTVITALEVLMRRVYSLIYDHRHVVLGKSIFDDVYSRTRNEFLNLGSASKWLGKVTRLSIKNDLSKDDSKFLSRMYSARHIVVHNCSIKDKDFLSQTGDPDTELGKPLQLRVPDIDKLISVSRRLARELDKELRRSLLQYQNDRLNTIRAVMSRL